MHLNFFPCYCCKGFSFLGGDNLKNANGKGGISQDKVTGKWRAYLTDPMGKRVMKRFSTKEEADAWLTNTRAEIYKGSYIQADTITVSEWMLIFVEEYRKPNIKEKTYVGYLNTLVHLSPIGNVPLQKLNAPTVQKFLNNMDASNYVKRECHRLLKAGLNQAVALDMLRKNVMAAVSAPKLPKAEVEVFTKEEIAKILEAAKESRFYLIILTAISTGARMGEILGLKRGDIGKTTMDINCSVTEVLGRPIETSTKTLSSTRKVTISPTLAHQLKNYNPTGTVMNIRGYIFMTSRGTPFSTTNVDKAWKGILEKAGVPYRKFHCLRHTHATQLLTNGVPLLEVAKRLGHASASITLNIYGHAIKGFDEQIPEQVNKIFGL